MRRSGGHPVLAGLIDYTMRPLESVRQKVVPRARGRVLEIGVGTGLNLPWYAPDQLEALDGIDPDPHMRRRAIKRLESFPLPATIHDAGAEELPFEDASFDEVVMTFTLCTVASPQRALAEMRRVLVPGGRLHFAEHTSSDFGATAFVQRALDPIWSAVAGGCHITRNAAELLTEAGFEVVELHGHGRTPFNLTPVHRGLAKA